ncbi:MAG: DUF4304 domain-containing protein [Bacteroidota bacterium]
MTSKTFKQVIQQYLVSKKGYLKKGNLYSFSFKDITIVIGLQKSSYSNGYYINIGYVIAELNPTLQNPRDVDGDVRCRFGFDWEGKHTDYFDLEMLSDSDSAKLERQLEENVIRYVAPVKSLDSLKVLVQENPTMLYQTKLSAKKLMGFEL